VNKNLQVNKSLEKNNEEEFNQYFSQHYLKINRYIFKYLRDDEMSKDITQNVFAKLYNNLTKLKKDNLKSWLYKVAHNDSIEYLKKKSLKVTSLDDEFVEPFTLNTPQTIVQQKYEREIIHATMMKLPKNQRSAILLKDVKGYSYDEIAEAMGISYEAVKSLIYRGRQNFIKYYGEVKRNEM